MRIEYDKFTYNGAWYAEENIEFDGRDCDVDIQIYGYDEEIIPESSKKALDYFCDNMNSYFEKIAEKVYEYYSERLLELGVLMGTEGDHVFSTKEEILKSLKLVGVTVPDQDDYDEMAISLVFNCTWDEENGVGVCFVGQEIDEVGTQDIAL